MVYRLDTISYANILQKRWKHLCLLKMIMSINMKEFFMFTFHWKEEGSNEIQQIRNHCVFTMFLSPLIHKPYGIFQYFTAISMSWSPRASLYWKFTIKDSWHESNWNHFDICKCFSKDNFFHVVSYKTWYIINIIVANLLQYFIIWR